MLYRGNYQAKAIEKALRLLRMPYHLTGGQAFFDRAEVKDLLAWLRLLANPDDDAAFLRAVVAPKREVGATTLERLGELAGSANVSLMRAASSAHVLKQLSARPAVGARRLRRPHRAPARHRRRARHRGLADALLPETGYDGYLRATAPDKTMRSGASANVGELLEWLARRARAAAAGDGVGDLAAQLAILTNADRDDPGNAVRLMTLHSAKGLEFPHVFLVGVEDGTLPHEGGIEEGRLEEERRLFYVGITRAKAHLRCPMRRPSSASARSSASIPAASSPSCRPRTCAGRVAIRWPTRSTATNARNHTSTGWRRCWGPEKPVQRAIAATWSRRWRIWSTMLLSAP